MAANTPDPEEVRRKALETATVVEDALRSIAGQIGDIFENALSGADRVSQAMAKDIQSRFNKFAKITDDISSNILKMEKGLLSTKTIQDQIYNRKKQELSLGTQLTTVLKQQGVQLENVDELNEKIKNGTLSLNGLSRKQRQLVNGLVKEYQQVQNINEDYIRELEQQNKEIERQEKALGLTGKIVKDIAKIPVFGKLIDAEKAAAAASEEAAKKGSNRFKVMGAAAKEVGKSFATSLTDPMFILGEVVSIFASIDKGASDLAKGMNLSYGAALDLRKELGYVALKSGDTALNTKRLQESYMAIGQSLGANADINEKDLETFTKLREQAGFTNDELIGMQKMSLVTGKTLEDTTKEFLGGAKALASQKGLAINVKQLMKETANASNATKLSLVGGAKGLAEAAVQAKALGVDLSKVDQIAGSLLNFEDSISAELEAELLTGKAINLETARLAALNGDMATVAEEIKKQIGGSAEFSKMNRIQQEAFAKSVGMSREDLANSLVESEALQKVGVKSAEEAKKKYETLRKTMSAEEAAKALGDEQLATQYEQQGAAERFSQSIEKLKDLFSNIVAGPFGTILEMIGSLVENAGVVYTIFGAIATVMTGKMLMGLGRTIAQLGIALGLSTARAAAEVTAAEALTLGAATVGIVLGLAAVMGAMYAASKPETPVKDAHIGPDGGLIVSGEKGTYSLDPNDSVIAGTNLNSPNKNPNSGVRNESMSIDYERLAAAMAKVNLQPVINLDGKKISDSSVQYNNTTAVKIQ
jgi:hypothetical protein